jgi:predicted solute-binding protein
MNSEQVIEDYTKESGTAVDVKDYLENKISYSFNERKKFSLELFLNYMSEVMEKDVMKIV